MDKTRLCISSPNKFAEYECIKADGRDVHVLTVSGTYYDMGVYIGRHLGQYICSELVTTYPSLKRKISILLKKDRKVLDNEIEETIHIFDPVIPNECKMDMLGIYDGCREAGYQLAEEHIFEKLIACIELGEQECSLFACQPPMTTGYTYQLRDLDYYKNINMNYIPTMIIRIPQNNKGELIDIPYVNFDFVPNVGGGLITGMNEYGLVFSQSRGPFEYRLNLHGMPLKCFIQQVISKANNAEQALKLMPTLNLATSHFVIISDPHQNSDSLKLLFIGPSLFQHVSFDKMPNLSIIKYSDEGLRFYQPINGCVYWTDMVNRRVNGEPCEFLMKDMYSLLKNYETKLNASNALTIAKQVGNDITFISALFNSTTKEAWVAFADRRKPAHDHEFIHFDLKKYFSYKDKLL